MTPTRHTKVTGIYYRKFWRDHWQHVDMNDPGKPAQVGPVYRTRAELLADHDDYVNRAGWMPSTTTETAP